MNTHPAHHAENDGHRDADLAAVAGPGIAGVVPPKAEMTAVRDVAGRMVDAAVVRRARRILALATASTAEQLIREDR